MIMITWSSVKRSTSALACLLDDFNRCQEQEWHELEMKVAVHRAPCISAFDQTHLFSVVAKAQVRGSQRRFAEDYSKPTDCVETAHFSVQAYIGINELEFGDTAGQQMFVELGLGTVF